MTAEWLVLGMALIVLQASLLSLWVVVRLPQAPLRPVPFSGADLCALFAIQAGVLFFCLLLFSNPLRGGKNPAATDASTSATGTAVSAVSSTTAESTSAVAASTSVATSAAESTTPESTPAASPVVASATAATSVEASTPAAGAASASGVTDVAATETSSEATGTASAAAAKSAGKGGDGKPLTAEGMARNLQLDLMFKFLGLTAMVAFLFARGATWADLGLVDQPEHLFRDVRWGCFAFLAVMPWALAIKTVAVQLSDKEDVVVHPIIQLLQSGGSSGLWVLSGMAVLVSAPLWEEFVFRQLLQGWGEAREQELRERRGFAWANGTISLVLTAVLFAFVHASWPDPLPLLPVAIGLGWLRLKTQGLVASMTMHFLVNFLTFCGLLVPVLIKGA